MIKETFSRIEKIIIHLWIGQEVALFSKCIALIRILLLYGFLPACSYISSLNKIWNFYFKKTEKIEKQCNSKVMNLLGRKVLMNLYQDFKMMTKGSSFSCKIRVGVSTSTFLSYKFIPNGFLCFSNFSILSDFLLLFTSANRASYFAVIKQIADSESPRGVVVSEIDCGILVCHNLSNYWERYKIFYPPSYGLNCYHCHLSGRIILALNKT